MTPIPAIYANAWPRIRGGLFVLTAVSLSALAFAIAMRSVDQNFGRFLKVSRRVQIEEASAAIPIHYALSSQEKNDVICLGDSTCLWGPDPLYFEKLTGLRAYNLGSLWVLGIDGMIVTAKAYLANHPPPKIIALCVSPEVVGLDATDNSLAHRFVRVYGRPFGVANRDVNKTSWIDMTAIEEGASLVREHAAGILGGNRDVLALSIEGLSTGDSYYDLAQKRGARRGHDILPGPADVTPDWSEQPGFRVVVAAVWREGVRNLARVASAAGSTLLIRLTPMRTDARSQDFSDVIAWLREVQQEFPEAVIKTEILFYDNSDCWNRRHLNSVGEKKFTEVFAKDVLGAIKQTRVAQASPISANAAGSRPERTP